MTMYELTSLLRPPLVLLRAERPRVVYLFGFYPISRCTMLVRQSGAALADLKKMPHIFIISTYAHAGTCLAVNSGSVREGCGLESRVPTAGSGTSAAGTCCPHEKIGVSSPIAGVPLPRCNERQAHFRNCRVRTTSLPPRAPHRGPASFFDFGRASCPRTNHL